MSPLSQVLTSRGGKVVSSWQAGPWGRIISPEAASDDDWDFATVDLSGPRYMITIWRSFRTCPAMNATF